MRRASYLVLFATTAIILLVFSSPRSSGNSTDPCNQCHSTYHQNLDILEGNSANKIPSTIEVGETKTVTIVVENNVNTEQYSKLSDVCASLSSKNGHFSVTALTCNIGDLQSGTATATWQITGVSSGTDSLSITVTGNNQDMSASFSDNYSPSPVITVAQSTSTSSPTPTFASTPTPEASPTNAPTSTTQETPTPTKTTTPPIIPTPTTSLSTLPSQSPLASPTPSPAVPEITPSFVLLIFALVACVAIGSKIQNRKQRTLNF